MPQVLLLNPGGIVTKKTRKSGARKSRTPAQKRATAKMLAANRSRRAGRSAPRSAAPKRRATKRRAARRSNPVTIYRSARPRAAVKSRRRARRRSNPIGGSVFNVRSYIAPLKDAAVMGAGAVLMDVAFGYINRYVPAQFQAVPGQLSMGTALKAAITVALGKLLAKPTRGYSNKAAMGSLVVQMRDVAASIMPASMGGVAGLAWNTSGRVVPMNTRANMQTRPGYPMRGQVGAFVQGGGTPLLSRGGGQVGAFVTGGGTPLLSRGVPRPAGRR